jgi:hypothetical protein
VGRVKFSSAKLRVSLLFGERLSMVTREKTEWQEYYSLCEQLEKKQECVGRERE